MFPKSATRLGLAAALLLAGCGRSPARAPDAAQAKETADYAAPPAVTAVRPEAGGPLLSGTAPPGAQVRLGSPAGGAALATADAAGRWSLRLAPSSQPRIFGLSAKADRRLAQGQGYVLLTPQGPAALLRAGAGAIRLDPRRSPSLSAVDFDREGGAVVSGLAPPQGLVFLRLDGRQIAETRADPAGRYAIALNQPVAKGAHTVEVTGDSFTSSAQVAVAPAPPLASGPMRSQFTKGGLRIDWLTPGGGVQSTVLLD
ncbi:MAG: hypothetical protein JWP49_302 [Phenylobacterium sp.]|nr:hypothetical protein [Phenylobacterium sp.]